VSVAEGGFDNQRHLFFFLVYTFPGAWGLRRSGVWECPQYGTMGGYVSGQLEFSLTAWIERFLLLGGYRFCSVLSALYIYPIQQWLGNFQYTHPKNGCSLNPPTTPLIIDSDTLGYVSMAYSMHVMIYFSYRGDGKTGDLRDES